MKKLIALGFLSVSFAMHAAVTEAYGIIKPTKEMPAVGILHFKENNGLELEGYFSRVEESLPIEVAVWTMDDVKGKPFCVGPQIEMNDCQEKFPLRLHTVLGTAIPDKNGYGEISLKLKGVSLDDLSSSKMKVLIYHKDKKSQVYSTNLVNQKYSMVELRWIED